MSVVLSVEEAGPCRKRLKVEVPAATVEAETARITAEYRGQARLPGFRKGKVPSEIVLQRFGEEIQQEVVDRLLPRYWRQAEAEAELDPILPPTVEDVSHLAGAPLTFTALVEVRPEFELKNLEDFDLPPRAEAASDEELDRALEDLRRDVAPWVEVEKEASNGLLVEARLREVDGSDEEEHEVAFEVGDPNVWEELSIEVTGKKAGQKASFSREETPAEPGEGEEAAAPVRREYRLELTAVKERELPELDDELAARLGKFDDAQELIDDVRRRLDYSKQQEGRRMRESALLDQLRQRNPTELPEGVVEREVRSMLTDYAEGLSQRGVDPSQAEIDWEALATEVRPQAEARVHSRLLLDGVAGKLEIRIPEDEFEATLAGLARAQGVSAGQLRQALDRDGRLQELRAQLQRERALRRLLGEEETNPIASPVMAAAGAGAESAGEEE